MLKALLKKQLAEVFRTFFFNNKTNKKRSKSGVIAYSVFFIAMLGGVLGGSFTMLSISLCRPLSEAGMAWLYFLILSLVSVLLGIFGSVFNTYSALYLAKDNDLLLSMPIPPRTIVAARLLSVYLLGTMYSSLVLIPAVVVYWVTAGLTLSRFVCGLILLIIVTVFVLVLSCVLGWVVAKISLKLKNKSFVTTFAAVLFLGLYYVGYFKAAGLIGNLLTNIQVYGIRVRGAAYALYLFGRIGEGAWGPALIFTAFTALLAFGVGLILSRSFIGIATSSGKTEKAKYNGKPAKSRSSASAVFFKELNHFTSSSGYMLNCGLGLVFIFAAGVVMIFKGGDVYYILDSLLSPVFPGSFAVAVCTILFMISSMNCIASPSVSLEGKSLWILQSLPVHPATVLRAKAKLQFVLSVVPVLFASICTVLTTQAALAEKVFILLIPLLGTAFFSLFDTMIAVKMPMLNWTSEIVPIKQSMGIVVSLFGGWGVGILFGGLYFLVAYRIGTVLYMTIWTLLLAASSFVLLRWINTRGARQFAAL